MIEERKRLCEILGINESVIKKEYGDNWDDCMRQLYEDLLLELAYLQQEGEANVEE